jgi:hypothetical protein
LTFVLLENEAFELSEIFEKFTPELKVVFEPEVLLFVPLL